MKPNRTVGDDSPVERRRVVVTGAAGRLGSILLPSLAARYEVVGVDRKRVGAAPFRRASVSRLRSLVRLLQPGDVVVHLAADHRVRAPWKSVAKNNIAGTRNVLEAARLVGASRVIFASSNAVTAGHETDEPWASLVAGRYDGLDPSALPQITTVMPVRPTGPYALSKVFGEAACRYYSDTFGLSTICLRIGSVAADDRPHKPREFATLLSHRDLVELIVRSIEAPDDVRFALLYGVSANTWRFYDLSDASTIGFEPVDDAEKWRSAADK